MKGGNLVGSNMTGTLALSNCPLPRVITSFVLFYLCKDCDTSIHLTLHTFGPLEIHIFTEKTSNPASALGSLTYSIERTGLDEKDRLPEGSLVIDPLGLTKEALFELPMDNSFYISCQDVTLWLTSFPPSVP